MTNYEKYFGTPEKATDSIIKLVAMFDADKRGKMYSSEFTNHFKPGYDCDTGLHSHHNLLDWLLEEK